MTSATDSTAGPASGLEGPTPQPVEAQAPLTASTPRTCGYLLSACSYFPSACCHRPFGPSACASQRRQHQRSRVL